MSAIAPWLRGLAIVIAIVAVVDPAVTRSAAARPDVALVAEGPLPDPALVDRVANALEPVANVVRGPSIGAAGVVSVGNQLPDQASQNAPVAFAVVPTPKSPWVTIESIRTPGRANLQARAPIDVTVRARAARGRSLTVQLEVNGVAVDSASRPVAGDDELIAVQLGLVSAVADYVQPTITTRIDGAATTASAETYVRFASDRHSVLIFDRRPSWMSTFVRRALEADARFVVSSRVSTSRAAAAVSGRAPAALALSDLEVFDVVMVGAPDSLTASDADGLEAFARGGGTVVLLMDAATDNAAVDRLTGVRNWTRANRAEPAGVPLASELQSPAELPRWAEPVAFAKPVAPNAVPSIWQTPAGYGRLIVSGALDAWRYRDRDNAGFDRFFRLLAADAVHGKRVIDTLTPGRLRGPTPDQQALLGAWTSSHRGAVIADSDLPALTRAVNSTLTPPVGPHTFHPMRSAWWIVPFAGLLGIEWWTRRKNGQR